ncbi:hypothetical protein [Kitasatospora fiedleri]|uniref:hypothetical protein n=1 Tax=Kitasatospora fiedleri TaxID=2991545 RepID=UPI00249B4EEA|nr:hypothetical protein [Kitasatospora fiedleri]
MSAGSACGLCGIARREHDRRWVDTVPHRFVPPTAAQVRARMERANSRKQVAQ